SSAAINRWAEKQRAVFRSVFDVFVLAGQRICSCNIVRTQQSDGDTCVVKGGNGYTILVTLLSEDILLAKSNRYRIEVIDLAINESIAEKGISRKLLFLIFFYLCEVDAIDVCLAISLHLSKFVEEAIAIRTQLHAEDAMLGKYQHTFLCLAHQLRDLLTLCFFLLFPRHRSRRGCILCLGSESQEQRNYHQAFVLHKLLFELSYMLNGEKEEKAVSTSKFLSSFC